MAARAFPTPFDAPSELLRLNGHCGLVSVWMVLKHLQVRTSAARIVRACRYTKPNGTFTICLGVALREHGLDVRFYSRHDRAPHLHEQACLKRASRLGVRVGPPLSVGQLLGRLGGARVAVVLLDGYDAGGGGGHFSPLVGVDPRDPSRVVLPNTPEGTMTVGEFSRRWSTANALRQCLVVERVGLGSRRVGEVRTADDLP